MPTITMKYHALNKMQFKICIRISINMCNTAIKDKMEQKSCQKSTATDYANTQAQNIGLCRLQSYHFCHSSYDWSQTSWCFPVCQSWSHATASFPPGCCQQPPAVAAWLPCEPRTGDTVPGSEYEWSVRQKHRNVETFFSISVTSCTYTDVKCNWHVLAE